MQSPTTRTCGHCAKRPADQTLFTAFMRCGEGDATKRKEHLCDQCRHHAMLVLHHIGMTIAFEGDGQLRWDAHVTLSEHATRSLARRAMQHHDLLVQLRDASAANRAPVPSTPEKLSILHQLAAGGLVENTIERSEFRPDDTCRLTANGQDIASLLHNQRFAEAGGLPMKEWSPLYVLEQGTVEEFREHADREYADHQMASPEGVLYDAGKHLMLRRDDPGPDGETGAARGTHLFFDEEVWTIQPIHPIGYFFFEEFPAIAFDADDVQILAEYYELIRAVAGPGVRWTLMSPTPANPLYPDGAEYRTVRASGSEAAPAAFVSIFRPPGERPEIELLRKRARQQDDAGEGPGRRRPHRHASRTSAWVRRRTTREDGGRATMGQIRSATTARPAATPQDFVPTVPRDDGHGRRVIRTGTQGVADARCFGTRRHLFRGRKSCP